MMPKAAQVSSTIHERPVELLQNLIRFDTTNPPGNEAACIQYINGLLQDAGISTTIVEKVPGRPNLVARLPGEGKSPPLLMYGHVDVVTTQGQQWTHPPFEANIVDGYIWGRGALDMKHGITMYLAAMLKARAEGMNLPGDLLFAAMVDEEVSSEAGAKFLADSHRDLFTGVRYAISEFGGATVRLGGKRFYPIQTAEKQVCPARVTFRGTGGHAAVPIHGGAMAKMAEALRRLDRQLLPVHVTPPAREMIEALADGMGGVTGLAARQLLKPILTNLILKVMGENGATFSPLLHNSVSPTILKAGDKINVIPPEVSIELDGRILPGFSAADLEKELRDLLGEDCTIETFLPDPCPTATDMGLYPLLAESIRKLDPQGIPVPFVNFAVTDARFISRLGIQTYGFTPLQLGEGLILTNSIHNVDERVPVAGLEFGLKAVMDVIQQF